MGDADTAYAEPTEAPREHGITEEAPPSQAPWTKLLAWDSLRYQGSRWWIDRALPRSPAGLIAAAVIVPAVWFAIGLAITDDRSAYIATPDVKYQLWFLALHIIVVRMVASLWMRGLVPAMTALHVDPAQVARVEAGAVGTWANLGAILAGGYFIARDTYMAFHAGPSGLNAFDDPDMWGFTALGHQIRTLMLIAWHLEWVMFGYLLALQIWALYAVTRAFRRTDFTPHLATILVRDEYRGFLALMSKTATLSLVFALGNLGFIALTGELFPREVVHIAGVGDVLEQMSDVLSITLLFVVIIAATFTYLIALRRALTRAVNHSFGAIGDAALELIAQPVALTGDDRADAAELRRHLDAHSAIVRAVAFQREIDQIGGRFARAVLAKAAPAMGAAAKRVAKMHIGAP